MALTFTVTVDDATEALELVQTLATFLLSASPSVAELITHLGDQMNAQLQALTSQVQSNTDVIESAAALINGLAAQIEANKNDPAALQQLADTLKAEDDKLAGAIAANTPVSEA